MRGAVRRMLVMGWGSTAVACAPEGQPPTDCPTGPVVLEVGTGTGEWTDLREGDLLEIRHGPQGGYHVFGSVRARGVDPGDPEVPYTLDNPHITLQLWVEDDSVAAFVDQPRALEPAPDGWFTYLAQSVVFTSQDPPTLAGLTGRFEATVADRCQNQAADATMVVLDYGEDTGGAG